MAFKFKEISLFLMIILCTIGLAVLSYIIDGIILFEGLSQSINKQMVYQPATLGITIVFLLLLYATKKDVFLTYFKKGHLSAKIIPEPYVGIVPKEKENWSHIGKNFAVVISLVTTIVMYFQIFKTSDATAIDIVYALPFGVLFALSNSFVEESITRFGIVVVQRFTTRQGHCIVIRRGIWCHTLLWKPRWLNGNARRRLFRMVALQIHSRNKGDVLGLVHSFSARRHYLFLLCSRSRSIPDLCFTIRFVVRLNRS